MILQVVSGSTLPTNRMALLNTYMEMYKMGLIDQTEVLKEVRTCRYRWSIRTKWTNETNATTITSYGRRIKESQGRFTNC